MVFKIKNKKRDLKLPLAQLHKTSSRILSFLWTDFRDEVCDGEWLYNKQ